MNMVGSSKLSCALIFFSITLTVVARTSHLEQHGPAALVATALLPSTPANHSHLFTAHPSSFQHNIRLRAHSSKQSNTRV